jgi:hypothetical protein
VLAGKRGKGCFDFLIGAGIENDEPLTQRACCLLHIPDLHRPGNMIGICKQRDDLRARNDGGTCSIRRFSGGEAS